MRLTIHRGSKEIGGSCVDLQSGRSRILVDFGLSLTDERGQPFDSRKIKGASTDDLIESALLPDIEGLYRDTKPMVNAVLLSHPHQDHYGLLSFVHPEIPIYMSEETAEVHVHNIIRKLGARSRAEVAARVVAAR